ncbi:MAG: hypothetical protein ABI650_05815 [Dokdonella sp.]
MLLAPFALADTTSRPRPRRAVAPRRPAHSQVPAWLVTWLVLGALAVTLVPPLRGGDLGGWTLPFWLVVAPLVNVLWLSRAHWLKPLRRTTLGRR